MAITSERIALSLLMAGVPAFPFPYGGITAAGTCAIAVIAFTVLSLTLLGRPAMARVSGAWTSIAALTGIAFLGIVQLLPMPLSLLAWLSPASMRVYADAASVLALFGRGAPAARISIAPTETSGAILLTLAYVALFVSAALLLRSRVRRRRFLFVLLGCAAIHVIATALMGAFVRGGDSTSDRIRGAFVNPNHFSAYLEIMLILAFVALWREILYAREQNPHMTDRSSQFEFRFLRISTRVLLWGLLAMAIGLTKSRAGILVVLVTLCLMIPLGLLHNRVRQQRLAVGLLGGSALAAGLGFVALAVRQQPILRFLASDPRDPTSDLRMSLWRHSLEAWQEFPIFGSGLGSFREAFRRVQPRDLKYLVEFAHSDPLQLLVTGGALGFLLAATAYAIFGARLLRRWRHERRREESAYALGGLGALFALALHGLVEFNMSIPAIPATLAAVLGLSWAATHDDEPIARLTEESRGSSLSLFEGRNDE